MNYLVISDIVNPETNRVLIHTGSIVTSELLGVLEYHYAFDELPKLVMPIPQ